ncbi:MAG: glycosyltransferase family A protein [Robiginitalea sp.]|uniref:glycosyltransferase family 2 protein n=1 Tax=Robiginitalea sp. TaxID=1902411 RepID=UPI003C77B062
MKEDADRILIVIPAHNEGAHITECLESFVNQTRIPDEVRVVNDNSSDQTAALVIRFAKTHPWIKLINRTSSEEHLPGAKVVQAFTEGLGADWSSFDFIGKFDADILLPPDYFEEIQNTFLQNPKTGLCSGLLYVEKEGQWIYEAIANTNHVRGPVKLYSRACFSSIGGLRPFIGWDTADVLLARYHGFEVRTLPNLKVKHLRPTGAGYSARNARFQGKALYHLNYGWLLSLIAAGKMGLQRKKSTLPWHAMKAYLQAYTAGAPRMLDSEEGKFVRQWRWKQIMGRLF